MSVRYLDVANGMHASQPDSRDERVLVWVNGELVPREDAVVSVFDAGFVLGDGVWEGLRVVGGHPAFLERHLDRLFDGARALMLDVGHSRREGEGAACGGGSGNCAGRAQTKSSR